MRHRSLSSLGALLILSAACGGGDSEQECEEACDAIQAACASTDSDCVSDCSSDLAICPEEMGAVLDCVLANRNALLCDPEEDQGLAEAPCQAQHDAVQADPCNGDPF